MRLTFIGTSAGEGYPGFWCECENCEKARKAGGKSLRGNTCAMLGEDTLLDMNDHFFYAAPRMGIAPGKITRLLVTHPHHDHFAPEKLTWRARKTEYARLSDAQRRQYVSPRFTELPLLTVYGNPYVKETLLREAGDILSRPERYATAFYDIPVGEEFSAGDDLRVTAVRAIHGNLEGFSDSFILRQGGKTLLYACDTGGYEPEMMALLLAKRYDCVVMEGTFGLGAIDKNHMALVKNRAFREALLQGGAITRNTHFYLTHLCPHWTPPHEEYAAMLAPEGISVAYDGLSIEI